MRPSNPTTPAETTDTPRVEDSAVLAELDAAKEKIENLETALVTARKIGTAVGIVMANYKVTDQAAFDLLVMSSQRTHQKIRDISLKVIETGDLGGWADVAGQ